MPNFYLIAFLFLTTLSGFSQQGKLVPTQMESISDYYIQNWTTEDGLTQHSVNDLIQTQEGYLILATFGGLVRYDGVSFETYTIGNTPGLESNRTFTLLETDSGSLWVGHREGGVSILKDWKIQTPKILEDISHEFVQDFCEDFDGNVWIATANGLYRYRAGKLDRYHFVDGLPGRVVSRLFLHNSGAVHFITDIKDQSGFAHGLILDGKINILKKYPTKRFNILDYNSKGELWIAYPDKIVVEKDGSIIKSINLGSHDLREIHKFLKDREGNFWLGSQQDVAVIPREEVEKAKKGPVKFQRIYHFPRENDISRISQDKEGNVWVGTSKEGLFMFKKRVVKRYFPSANNASSVYTKVAPDGHGGVWFSKACNDLTHYKNGKFSQFESFEGCVRELHNDPKNEAIVYVGVDAELGKIEDFRYEKIANLKELVNEHPIFLNITAIQKANDGSFWLGTSGNGIVVFKDSVVNHYTSAEELTGDLILTIKKTRAGDIWVGTNVGITVFGPNGIREITAEDGLVRGDIRSIFEDSDGVIWVGSYGAGLSRIEDGRITSYTANDGLFENIVSRITEDINGNLWMIGNLGLYMLDRQQFYDLEAGKVSKLTCRSFELEDGMIEGNNWGQVAKSADGLTWWPTIKGMAAINIDKDYQDPFPTKTLIQKVVISDEVTAGPVGESVTLAKDQRDIEVAFAGMKFSNPEKIYYRYKLEGYDKDWRENGIKRTVNYTNLNPGSYQLKIEASNLNGAWEGEPVTLEIIVEPTVWEMVWTKIIAALLLLLLVWLSFVWRNRYLIRKKEEMAAIVKLRTKELHDKNQELEATLENLKITHDKLVQSEKMASLGTMIAGVSHEINNPLQFIQNGLDILKKSRHAMVGVDEHLDPSLEIIGNGVKRASEIVQSLNQFSRANEDFNEVFDVKEVLENCLVILRNRLSCKASVAVEISDEKLMCHGNQGKLHQAFLNLLSNAEQAIDDTGKITIEAKKLTDKIEVAISDTGHGISPEIISRIFDPFFTTKPPGKGTGLGLSITYEIIVQHKGSIDIKSEPGKGSTFIVHLPL